jgi:hypothetical protein
MVQRAASAAIREQTEKLAHEPRVAVLADGPFGVPALVAEPNAPV